MVGHKTLDLAVEVRILPRQSDLLAGIRSQRAPRSSEEEHGVRKRVGRLLSRGRRGDGEKANPPPAVLLTSENSPSLAVLTESVQSNGTLA